MWFSCRDDFVLFAKTCFENYGDRVKYWTTFNEPNIYADMGYIRGVYPPGHCLEPYHNCSAGNSEREPLLVVHNMLISHAKAAYIYRERYQVLAKLFQCARMSCFSNFSWRDYQTPNACLESLFQRSDNASYYFKDSGIVVTKPWEDVIITPAADVQGDLHARKCHIFWFLQWEKYTK